MAPHPRSADSSDLTEWPPGLFRFIHLVGAVAWISFGVAQGRLVPDRWDPIGVRAAMAGLYLGLVVMSWSGRYTWTVLRRASHLVYSVTTFHALALVWMNDGNLIYSLGLVVNNVAIASGLERPRVQLAWGSYSVLGAAAVFLLHPAPDADPAFMILGLLCFHAIFTAIYWRMWRALCATADREALFTATFEGAGDALILLTADARISRANPRAEALLGRLAAELVGRAFAEFVADDALAPTRTGGDTVPMVRADGAPFTAEVLRNPLPNDAGTLVRMIDVTRALRDRAQLQAALRQAEAAVTAKGTFIATMSHEIRTPMTGVLGMLTLLEDGPLNREQRQRVGAATRSAQSLRRILDEILDYSKLESGHLDVHPQPTEPRALMQELADLFAPQLSAKGLTMPVRVGDDVPRAAMLDPVRVRQVLMNLLGNALKFTDQGQVELTLARDGLDRLAWAVRDTGDGIEPAALATIFEPFVQADASNSRSHGGTGLGLAISRELAELMGGELTAESTPGQGSRFVLRLPAPEAEPAVAAPAPVSSAGPQDLSRLKVLVAEDNAVNRHVVAGLLRRLGVKATLVEDGAAAVAAVRADPRWDVILMDIQMPNVDGLEATRTIRAEHAHAHRIVALTASVAQAERDSCLVAGMDGVLAKPIELSELSRVLEEASQAQLQSA